MNDKLVAVGMAVLVAALAWWMWSQADAPFKPPPSAVAVDHGTPTPAKPLPVRTSANALPTASVELPRPVLDALDAAWPGERRVTCPAGHLADGVLVGQKRTGDPTPGVSFAHVRAGQLIAVVRRAHGTALLAEFTQPAAMISWNGAEPTGTCTVSTLAWEPVQGEVTGPDGEPAADVEVRGCQHGEIVRTDADGRFSSRRVVGTTCHPMVFRVDGDRFGKGNVVDVDDDFEGPVRLTLPADDALWSPERQAAFVRQYRLVLGQALQRRATDNPAADALEHAADPEVRAILQRWADDTATLNDAMHDDANRLTEELDGPAALRDIWMNMY